MQARSCKFGSAIVCNCCSNIYTKKSTFDQACYGAMLQATSPPHLRNVATGYEHPSCPNCTSHLSLHPGDTPGSSMHNGKSLKPAHHMIAHFKRHSSAVQFLESAKFSAAFGSRDMKPAQDRHASVQFSTSTVVSTVSPAQADALNSANLLRSPVLYRYDGPPMSEEP